MRDKAGYHRHIDGNQLCPRWAMCIASTGSALNLIPGEHRSEVLSSLTWFRQSLETAFGFGIVSRGPPLLWFWNLEIGSKPF